MRLLDTDVMVDILCDQPRAVKWLNSLDEPPGVPGFVALELMEGCGDKVETGRLKMRLQGFKLWWPTQADCDRALTTFARVHLSHNTGILDAVIAECAIGLDASLCTFNVKQFRAIPGLRIEQTYVRTVSSREL